MQINLLIKSLLEYGLKRKFIHEDDYLYVLNGLLSCFQLKEFEEPELFEPLIESLDEILDGMLNYAINEKIIENSVIEKDLFDTKIMGYITPLPSMINQKFYQLYKKDSTLALQYFYQLCCDTNYIRLSRIKKDIHFQYPSSYGNLDISINLSKPEKDPNDIKKLLTQKNSSYPKCMLCKENINYEGRLNFPARQNLRYIPITLNQESFYLQYSPYSYYPEHAIVFSNEHKPMLVDIEAVKELLDFVTLFPSYFIGSNAGLPIVGGSILNHHHFQGGKAVLPMENAKEILMMEQDDVQYFILHWPVSVIRLKSKHKNKLIHQTQYVFNQWQSYSNPDLFIFAEDENGKHNAITVIARKKGEVYELDLCLRNNIVTKDRPLGYFHPRPDYFHIKKENIGLIEVMGLAILPTRLQKEMNIVKKYLLNELLTDEEIDSINQHMDWASDLKMKYTITNENVDDIIQNGIGEVFSHVLEDCGVFKQENEAEFKAFVLSLKKEEFKDGR